MSVDWEKIREEEYPTIRKNNLIYLLSAGASIMNKSAFIEGLNYLDQMRTYGDINYELLFLELDLIRKQIAEYINSNPEEIAFLINTTSGISASAYMLRKDKGELLYPSMEFPTSIHMFKKLGFPCVKIDHENGTYPIQNFQQKLSKKTKYSIQSYVQSFNGFKQILEEYGTFCEQNGLINIINSTQAFGVFEIDVEKYNIDILITNALKWLGCGYGVGIIYIKEDFIKKYDLPFTGWLSIDDPFSMDNENMNIIQKTKSIDSMGGCPNFAALLTLKGAFSIIKQKIGKGDINLGIKRIQERIICLTSYFFDELEKTKFKIITPKEKKYRSGIITVEHQNAKKIHRYLTKNNIHTTLKQYPKRENETLIRFAINYYNNFSDLEETIQILKSCKYL